MKQVDEMPKEGQFVAVWECAGEIWGDTYLTSDNGAKMLARTESGWIECEPYFGQATKFFISE